MEKELLPLVQEKLKAHIALCKKRGITFRVTSAYRSIEEQDKLYAQGRTKPGQVVTNARGGHSFHNWRVAYDVVPIVNGQADYNEAILSAIGYFGKQCGLEWGGDWTTFKDMPHFQLTQNYSLSDFINGKVDYLKFGGSVQPGAVLEQPEAIPTHAQTFFTAIRDFQLKEGITDFAGEKDLSKIRIGDKTLTALAKYQK